MQRRPVNGWEAIPPKSAIAKPTSGGPIAPVKGTERVLVEMPGSCSCSGVNAGYLAGHKLKATQLHQASMKVWGFDVPKL